MSSDREISPEKMFDGIDKIANKIGSLSNATDLGLDNKVVISETKEKAKNREEYERFMKKSEIEEDRNMNDFVDNIVNNIVDDLFDRYL